MKKISFFFSTLVKSISSPSYYADVLKAKLSFSLKYFFMLTMLLALITVIKIAVPLSLFNVPAAADQIVNQYPADLQINVDRGHLSINKPVPYAIPIRSEWREKGPANFVVFESDKNVMSPQDFYKYDTLALVTETSIYTNQENNDASSIKVYEIPQDAQNVMINSSVLNGYKNQFLNMPVVKNKVYVPIFVIGLFLVSVPLMYLFRMSTAYTYALICYILFKFFNKQLVNGAEFSMSKLFQVSLHTTTLPILLAYLTSFVLPFTPIHGLLYFAIYFIFTVYVLKMSVATTRPATKKIVAKKSKK